jgi:signal transduction histidine kinase
MAKERRSVSLRWRARFYACGLLAYGIGVGYLATQVLDPQWGFVLIASALLLGVATTLYFLELYDTALERALAQEERLEGAVRTIQAIAEQLRQPLTVLLGHGELLRARGKGPLDPSVEESVEEMVTTAADMEAYLCQLEAANLFAQRLLGNREAPPGSPAPGPDPRLPVAGAL